MHRDSVRQARGARLELAGKGVQVQARGGAYARTHGLPPPVQRSPSPKAYLGPAFKLQVAQVQPTPPAPIARTRPAHHSDTHCGVVAGLPRRGVVAAASWGCASACVPLLPSLLASVAGFAHRASLSLRAFFLPAASRVLLQFHFPLRRRYCAFPVPTAAHSASRPPRARPPPLPGRRGERRVVRLGPGATPGRDHLPMMSAVGGHELQRYQGESGMRWGRRLMVVCAPRPRPDTAASTAA